MLQKNNALRLGHYAALSAQMLHPWASCVLFSVLNQDNSIVSP
jgi:hypothetical protein